MDIATEGFAEVPGCTWDYLAPLASPGGRPVVFYDRLGCGNSDRPTDSSLRTLEGVVRPAHEHHLENSEEDLAIVRAFLSRTEERAGPGRC